jgi:Protein of unknown function (DUF4232)
MLAGMRKIVITSIAVASVGVPVAAIAAGSAHTTQSRHELTSIAATPRCRSSQLQLSVIGEQGALGTTYWDLGLRDIGRSPCHMRGYPGVGLVNSRNRLIKIPVQRVPGTPENRVTLRPGQSAYLTFGYVGEAGACTQHLPAYGVQVIPPDEHQRLLARRARFDVCTPSHVVADPQVYPIRARLRLNG